MERLVRILSVACAAVVTVAFASRLVEAKTWKFDFGRKDQPNVMAGFREVSVHDAYDKEKGFGWLDCEGEVKAGWLEERGTQFGCLRKREADPLSGDYVSGGKPFALDVPNGKYVVWLMVGDWGAYEFYPRGKYTVLVEGAVVGGLDHSTSAKFFGEFHKHRDEPFVPDVDLFEKYVEPRFRKYRTVVEVTDGQLNVQVKPESGPEKYGGPLNALIVYPEEERETGDAELRSIAAARKTSFNSKYVAVKTEWTYAGGVTDEDLARGFVAWASPYDDQLGFTTKRTGSGEESRLTAMVSLGEMEPVVLSVNPLDKEPGKLTCEVAQLIGNKGDRLPPSALSIRVARPWEMIVKRPTKALLAELEKKGVKIPPDAKPVITRPYFLTDGNSFDGREHVTRQFWLTVRMPQFARSTIYETVVTVTGTKGALAIPMTVTVIPVKLGRAAQAIGLNYGKPDHADWFDEQKASGEFWKTVEKDLRLMHDYGMTTVSIHGMKVPRVDHPEDPNRWEEFLKLYRKVGFERELFNGCLMTLYGSAQLRKEFGPPTGQPWKDAYVKAFREYDDAAKKLGQKVVHSIGDETTNAAYEQLVLHAAKTLKEQAADIRLISDINGYRELMALSKVLDAAGFNRGWAGNFQQNRPDHCLLSRDVIERVRANGAMPWLINGGRGRYAFGIWFWKATKWGVDGKIQWHYDASSSDPFNPFDGTSPNDFGSLVMPDQVCTISFEMCREGIDDLRYLQYLDKLVAQNLTSKDVYLRSVAGRGRYVLDCYNDLVSDRFMTPQTADGAAKYSGDEWSTPRLNNMRREVARLICMFKGTEVPGVYEDVMLIDGESGEQPEKQLEGNVELVEENATEGKHCFKLTFAKGKGRAERWGHLSEKDWRGYRSLVFDVVNPADRDVTLNLHVKDQRAANLGDTGLASVKSFSCKPGKNTFAIDIVEIQSSDTTHMLETGMIFSFHFDVKDETEDVVLYLDNMRLSPKAVLQKPRTIR